MKIFFIVLLLIASIAGCDNQSGQDYIKRGDDFASSGDLRSAVIEYKNAVKQEPENAQARFKLGQAHINLSNTLPAMKELEKAKQYGSNEPSIPLLLAKAYRQHGDFKKILDEINPNEIKENDLKAEILALHAIAWLTQGDPKKAEATLSEAKQLNENGTEVRLAWAAIEKNNQNFDVVKGLVKPLLEKNGGIADAWTLLAEVEQHHNNLDAAEEAFSRSIELRPYGHVDSIRRALLRIAQGNLDGAQKDVDKLKNAGANWPIIGHTDGLIAVQKKQYKEAQQSLQKVISIHPGYSPSQLLLAEVQYYLKNYSSARTLLEKYLSTGSTELKPNLLLADTLLRSGKVSEARQLLNKLYEQNTNNPGILSLLSSAALIQEDKGAAIRYLKKAINSGPTNVKLQIQLAALYLDDPVTIAEGRTSLIKIVSKSPQNIQAQKLLYDSYISSKEYDKARNIADSITKEVENNALGSNLKALTYLAEQKQQQAIEVLQEVLQRFPSDSQTLYNLAGIYLREGNLHKAQSLYEQLLSIDETNLRAINKLILIANRNRDDEKVLYWLKKGVVSSPDLSTPKLALASYYLRSGNGKEALNTLNEIAEKDKASFVYKLTMAQAKLALKENDHAVRLLKQIIKQNPDHLGAYLLLVEAYAQQNQSEKMRETLLNALQVDPQNITVNIIIAKLDLYEGRWSAFKKRVLSLQRSHAENKEVQLLSAKLDSGERSYGRAIEKLSTLMKDAPVSEVVIDLAINQWKAGNKETAIESLELWVDSNSEDTKALMMLAQFYLEAGNLNDAHVTYKKIEQYSPENVVVLNNIAWTLKDSSPEEGIRYAEKARKLSNDNPMILDTLGVLFLETGKFTSALDVMEIAVEKAPDMIDIQLNYARALVANRKSEEARSNLELLLRKSKSMDQRKLIKEELKNL